jgi:hypothetical protein
MGAGQTSLDRESSRLILWPLFITEKVLRCREVEWSNEVSSVDHESVLLKDADDWPSIANALGDHNSGWCLKTLLVPVNELSPQRRQCVFVLGAQLLVTP